MSGHAKFMTFVKNIDKLERIKSIACCNSRSYAVNKDNKIFIWGINNCEINNSPNNITNICVTNSLVNNLTVLNINGTISYYDFHNDAFEKIRCYDKIEFIDSIKSNEIIVLTKKGFIKRLNGRYLIKTKYNNIHDYCAEEFQMTYKTIDLKIQNVVQTKSLKIKGN